MSELMNASTLPPQKHLRLPVGIHTEKLIPKDSDLRSLASAVAQRVGAQIPEDAKKSYVWGMADLVLQDGSTVNVINCEASPWVDQAVSGLVTNVRLTPDFCSAIPENVIEVRPRIFAVIARDGSNEFEVIGLEDLGSFDRRGQKLKALVPEEA